ncbi:MAG: DNA-3-methyladenine glycosylase family protein [Syntrophales bacterium]
MQIQLPPGFSVEWMLNHIRTSSYGVPYRFADRCVLQRPLWLAGSPAVAEFDLSQAGMMGVRLLSRGGRTLRRNRTNAPQLDEIAAQARFLWGLDDDGRHDAAIAANPDLAPLHERFGVLRIVRAPDLYEALLVAVIGQQVSVRAAQSTRRRLMHTLGTKVMSGRSAGDESHRLYPTPRQLLEAGEAALREQGLSRQKAAYLLEIAGRTAAGELDRAAFAGLTDDEAIARLCEIRGVGRWTAEIVLMRGLGRTDVFPAGDLGLQVAVQELLGLPERPSESVLRTIAARWQGWRSHAAFSLWMTLQSRAL